MEGSNRAEPLPRHEIPPVPSGLFGGPDVSLLSHFYRGEMHRLTVWRTRMDMTTNWAVLSTVGLLTFAFSNPLADAIYVVAISALWFLLVMEARRYRFYDVWRWRMRILEAHFIAPVVSAEKSHVSGPWREDLTADLLYPTFKISMREAMGRRLLRNYIFLFTITLVVALAHILGIQPATGSWTQTTSPAMAASVRENWILLCLIVAGYLPLIVLMVFAWRRRKMVTELHDQPIRRPYRV